MASDEIPNVYADLGRRLLSAYNDRHKDIPEHDLVKLGPIFQDPETIFTRPVCIVGAGLAGLYTAMILQSLGISYRIVDADTRERVGGRFFTYRFPNGGPYDYYDVGAMQFPDTPFMKRVFDLVRNRGLNVKLIPFIRQMVDLPHTFLYYNSNRVNNRAPSVSPDPFSVSKYINNPNIRTPEGVSSTLSEVIQPFRDYFRPVDGKTPDIGTAMDQLLKETNNFSMRSYMLQKGITSKDINWCETLDQSTGWYDRALTETVIESLDFNWPTTPLPGPEKPKNPNEGWFCFDGGSSTLPQAMFASLPKKVQDATLFKSPVTAISHDARKKTMKLSINGVHNNEEYSAVISTVPLPCLNLMDLTGVKINSNYAQQSAIRALQYAASIKIGIRFKSPWWSERSAEFPLTIRGGQSYTDLPIRSIVYPSYPKDAEPEDISKVLIVSYCWTQDAERLGVLMNGDGTAKPELIKIVLRDLAVVHGVSLDWLEELYTPGDYFAWDWNHNPLSMGAYALFGPGSYGDMSLYSEMIQPAADGKLFFAGDATSACHGWAAGALDSAWRAVDQYLAFNHPKSIRDTFWDKWGPNEYWDDASKKTIDQDHKLTNRHLVIGLDESGFTFQ